MINYLPQNRPGFFARRNDVASETLPREQARVEKQEKCSGSLKGNRCWRPSVKHSA